MALWKNGSFIPDAWRSIAEGEDAPPAAYGKNLPSGITPDFMCLSKGLTGGMLPLGAQDFADFAEREAHALGLLDKGQIVEGLAVLRAAHARGRGTHPRAKRRARPRPAAARGRPGI